MFLAIAHLPNAGIRKLPVFADPVQTLADLHPNVVGGGTDVLVGQVKRVHKLAVDVSLELRNGCIADANGPRPSIPFPVIQRLLWKLRAALDREDDGAGGFRIDVFGRIISYPAHEGSGLISEADAQKGIDREGCIADPGVAVIPIASASDNLGQTCGGRGYDGAGGLKSEKL